MITTTVLWCFLQICVFALFVRYYVLHTATLGICVFIYCWYKDNHTLGIDVVLALVLVGLGAESGIEEWRSEAPLQDQDQTCASQKSNP